MYKIIKKLIGALRFRLFELSINRKTWNHHSHFLEWAKNDFSLSSEFNSLIVKRGKELRLEILNHYDNKLQKYDLIFFIHVPIKDISPAGFSIFNGYCIALNYMGIKTYSFSDINDFESLISKIKPNVILASDNTDSLDAINWDLISNIKLESKLVIGLTASTDLDNNSDSLNFRLNRARLRGVDFFYSFKSADHIHVAGEFRPYFENNYKVYSIEFGCNPMFHFPLECPYKDLDFIFLASSNIDKRARYYDWLPKITKNFVGLIDGPGWHKLDSYSDYTMHNKLYSRARIGLNLHIQDSIDNYSELNERTYILAACGIPQLVDNALLLSKRFTNDSFFIASTPKEYFETFEYMLSNPIESERRALIALELVYNNYTIYARLEKFVSELNSYFNLYEAE